MGVIFNIKNSQLATFTVDRRDCSGIRPKAACGKSFSCRFSFSAARNAITKATEYITFGFYFVIMVRENSKNNHGLRMVKALLFIHQVSYISGDLLRLFSGLEILV